jgi:hypothetical protein
VRLPFSLGDETCPSPEGDGTGCTGDELLVDGVKHVALSRDGATLKVALTVVHWYRRSVCGPLGCTTIWDTKDEPRCFEVVGDAVTPAAACEPVPDGLATTDWNPAPENPLSRERSALRAFFTYRSDGTVTSTGRGFALDGGWLGDVHVNAELDEWWGLSHEGPVELVAYVEAGRPAWWLPLPGGQPFSAGAFVAPGATARRYWADPLDVVYEVLPSRQRFEVRPVREARLPPKTTTRGVLEDGADVFTVVESESGMPTLTPRGLRRVSLVRSKALGAPPRAWLPFGLVGAHTPTTDEVLACFTEPLDPAALAASQFTGTEGLEVLAAVASSTVPQCARLRTSPMLRDRAYALRVRGVRSAGGSVLGEQLTAVTGDTRANGREVVPVAPLVTTREPWATQTLALPSGTLLSSNAGSWGTHAPGGTVVELAGERALPLETQGGHRPDPVFGAFFVLSREASGGPLRLERRTATGLEVLDDAAGQWDGLVLWPLGDGSALLSLRGGTPGRARFPGGVTPLGDYPQAVDPVRGELYLVVAGTQQIQAQRLADGVLEPQTWARPTRVAGLFTRAVVSGTHRWFCSLNGLERLDAVAQPVLDPCEHVSLDPQGRPWATLRASSRAPARLVRLDGDQVVPVEVPHPLEPGALLVTPEFVGGYVFTNQLSLRLTLAEWNALTGGAP